MAPSYQIWFDWNWTLIVEYIVRIFYLWNAFHCPPLRVPLSMKDIWNNWYIFHIFRSSPHHLWTFLQSLSSLILHLPPDEEPHRTPLLPSLLCSGLSTAWCKVGYIQMTSRHSVFILNLLTSQSVLSENQMSIMR